MAANKLESSIAKVKNHKKKNKSKKGLAIFVALFLIIFVGSVAATAAYQIKYNQKIYPGIKMGSLDVGGKDPQKVKEQLIAFKDLVDKEGLIFQGKEKVVEISPIISSPADPDLNYRILVYNLEEDVDLAYKIGREKSLFGNILDQFNVLVSGKNIPLSFKFNQPELLDILKENFKDLESPAENAQLEFGEDDEIIITAEKPGEAFNYIKALEKATQNISNLKNEKVVIDYNFDKPEVTSKQAENMVEQVTQIIATTSPKIVYKNSSWQITKDELKDWIELGKSDGHVIVKFNAEKIEQYLDEIADKVNQQPRDAKFSLSNGRVTEFQTNRDGLSVDVEKANIDLNSYLDDLSNKEIELAVKVEPARVSIGDINNLGITELIGEGRSDFSGSPKNRRHNIAVGAATLNGLLIEPGEEFSLIQTLGDIDAANDYLPELVIKGNRTIPEYGGGLCQIGTTNFRVVLDAGLPITARRNHSYRVRYYEPAGTDATIYDPYPDFRFLNDTGYHILFTTIIAGDELIFRFYGTSDGRKVEMTKPRIFNVVAPGPTKLIETLDLPAGQKKCTEHAVYGADAQFERTITFPDGEVIDEVFKSHYVPWTEVCLIGVEELTATSTEEIIEE